MQQQTNLYFGEILFKNLKNICEEIPMMFLHRSYFHPGNFKKIHKEIMQNKNQRLQNQAKTGERGSFD